MTSLLHPITYWPPEENPTAEHHLGRIALKGKEPSGGVPRAGQSKAYLKKDVFRVGGVVADGTHTNIPIHAREIKEVDPRKSRRGKRTLYEATLSDYSGENLFDIALIYREQNRPDGMGGVIKEPVFVAEIPCDIVFTPAEDTVADHERPDGRYTLTALKTADLQTGDTVVLTSRDNQYLSTQGEVIRPPRSLYLSALLEVDDEQSPLDLQP